MEFDPGQLAALAAVVTEGTFDGAARALHVTPSAISQRVKALESTVGRVLVQRTKPARPTESGAVVLRLARQIATLTAETVGDIGGSAAGGGTVVPIAVNADSIDTWLIPSLASVRGSGETITFDLQRDDQHRTVALLRQGAVMAAVTSVPEAVPGCTTQRLGRMRYRVCASPSVAARWFADGPTPDALAVAPVVVYDRNDHLQDRYLRRRTRRRLDPPRHHVPGSHAFAEAVRLGLGWGMLPDQQTGALLSSGALVDLDPGRTVDVTLYWQQWRLRSTVLDTVASAVRAAAGTVLD